MKSIGLKFPAGWTDVSLGPIDFFNYPVGCHGNDGDAHVDPKGRKVEKSQKMQNGYEVATWYSLHLDVRIDSNWITTPAAFIGVQIPQIVKENSLPRTEEQCEF